MKRNLSLLVVYFYVSMIYSQTKQDSASVKQNPIVFSELILGLASGSASGFTIGGTLNYQNKKNVYTFRYIEQTDNDIELAVLGFVAFPFITTKSTVHEFSILYGRRFVNDGESFSFSLGISNNTINFRGQSDDGLSVVKDNFFGVPFEVNIKWFKKDKKRFRAYYGIIPIGKPTSFGRSVGFKLYGNIGKISYVGLGINYGFGWHKKY